MNLKRGLVISLFAVSLPVAAKDINIQPLNQSDFHALSEDLGAALSYKPLTPTAPLGITGFDVGIAVTDTKLQNRAAFAKTALFWSFVPVTAIPTSKPVRPRGAVGVRGLYDSAAPKSSESAWKSL